MHAPRQQQRQPPRRRRPPPTALLLVTTVLLGAATTVTSFSFLPWPSLRLHSPASTLGWGGAGPSMQQRRQQRRPTAGARRGRRAVAWMKLKFEPGEDYYGRLGIEVNASLNDIKRAYRRLALQTHPDVNKAPDAAETFKKVCKAYKVLSDPDARRQYDMLRGGGAGARRQTAGGAGGGGGGSSRQWYEEYDPSGFRAARRREQEAADQAVVDDSFGSIFRDLVGTVAARGSKGVFEDFVDFLEEAVDGFGDESDAGFEEVLRSDDLEEVQKECESVQFLLNKLREKLQKAKVELMVLEGKLRVMQGPAAAPRDLDGVDKRLQIVEQAAAMRARVQDLEGHMKRADKRQRRLMTRAEELRWGTPGGVRSAYSKYANPGAKGSAATRFNTNTNTAGGGGGGGGGSGASPGASSSSSSSSSSDYASGSGGTKGSSGGSSVEDELAKLKKQMGL